MPATALVTGTGMTGVHIADPGLNRVVLFSAANDGSAPQGALVYSYEPLTRTQHLCQQSTVNSQQSKPLTRTQHLLFDLTPGARYRVTQTRNGAVQTVTLTPDANGPEQSSDQGVLSFVLPLDGEPEPSDTFGAYLPSVEKPVR
jgi:hypothetical protein